MAHELRLGCAQASVISMMHAFVLSLGQTNDTALFVDNEEHTLLLGAPLPGSSLSSTTTIIRIRLLHMYSSKSITIIVYSSITAGSMCILAPVKPKAAA